LEGFEEAADVAVAAFVEDDFKPGVFFAFAEDGGAFGGERAVVGVDAGFEGGEEGGIGEAVDLDVVGFVEVAGGVGDGVGPGGVVGEEEQAFTGLVEAADGGEVGVGGVGEAGEDGGAAFFVGGGGDEASGFIEDEVNRWSDGDEFAVDGDNLALELHWEFGVAADNAVDGDAAGASEGGAGTARAEAEIGEEAGEAWHGGGLRGKETGCNS